MFNLDPNELMALLQVYPWHADTLLQMSEVYRLQSGKYHFTFDTLAVILTSFTRRYRCRVGLCGKSAVRF